MVIKNPFCSVTEYNYDLSKLNPMFEPRVLPGMMFFSLHTYVIAINGVPIHLLDRSLSYVKEGRVSYVETVI